MSPRDGAVRVQDKHGHDLVVTRWLRHRVHAAHGLRTLCGQEINPVVWIRLSDAQPALGTLDLSCDTCAYLLIDVPNSGGTPDV